jgi:hypothetical protein
MRLSSKLFAFALVISACGGDDAGDEAADDTTGTDSGTDASTMTSPMTLDDSGPSSGTDPTLTTMTDPGSTSDATGTETGPDASSGPDDTGPGEECMPDDGDNACVACTKENCCDEIMACAEQVEGCECVLDCLGAIEDPSPAMDTEMCANECDVDYNAVLVPVMAVFICQNDQCSGGQQCGS